MPTIMPFMVETNALTKLPNYWHKQRNIILDSYANEKPYFSSVTRAFALTFFRVRAQRK